MHHLNHPTIDMSIYEHLINHDDNHWHEQMYPEALPGSGYHNPYGQISSTPYTQYTVVSN
jgi:hypothetical protein